MTKFQTPNVPYVEAHLQGGKQRPTAIQLDLSWTTSEKGAALGFANRLHGRNTPAMSYHYLVDEAMTYRGVWDNVLSCAHPRGALSVLICAEPQQDEDLWTGDARRALYRAASLVADLTLAYKIRPRYLDNAEVKSWLKHPWRRRGGIMTNIPGAWPSKAFLVEVEAQRIIKTM